MARKKTKYELALERTNAKLTTEINVLSASLEMSEFARRNLGERVDELSKLCRSWLEAWDRTAEGERVRATERAAVVDYAVMTQPIVATLSRDGKCWTADVRWEPDAKPKKE